MNGASPDPAEAIIDVCHEQTIPLGTPSGLCDRPRQSGVIAAQRIPGSREPRPQSPPTEPAPTVGCGAVHLGRDRETSGTQSPGGYRARCQAGHHPRLVSTLGGPEGSRHRAYPGRPRVPAEGEALVVRFARENRGWGYDRIVGVLANLGHPVSDRTVGKILRRHHIAPAPERSRTTSWKEFIQS